MTADRTLLLPRTLTRARRVVGFIGFFVVDFVQSNLLVLIEVLRPHRQGRPAVLTVPLRSRRPVELVAVANLITLTPGTLTLEVAVDPPTLYVHGMFAGDPSGFVAELQELEDRLLAALRPVSAEPDRADIAERDHRTRELARRPRP